LDISVDTTAPSYIKTAFTKAFLFMKGESSYNINKLSRLPTSF
jgi:hypothetical protein